MLSPARHRAIPHGSWAWLMPCPVRLTLPAPDFADEDGCWSTRPLFEPLLRTDTGTFTDGAIWADVALEFDSWPVSLPCSADCGLACPPACCRWKMPCRVAF